MKKEKGKQSSSTGLESNVAAALCYSLGLVTGILFFIVEKDDKFVRFHAMQSILANIVALVVPPILIFSIIGIVLVPFWEIAVFVVWILLMVKAYQGVKFILPYIGQIAESQVK